MNCQIHQSKIYDVRFDQLWRYGIMENVSLFISIPTWFWTLIFGPPILLIFVTGFIGIKLWLKSSTEKGLKIHKHVGIICFFMPANIIFMFAAMEHIILGKIWIYYYFISIIVASGIVVLSLIVLKK